MKYHTYIYLSWHVHYEYGQLQISDFHTSPVEAVEDLSKAPKGERDFQAYKLI